MFRNIDKYRNTYGHFFNSFHRFKNFLKMNKIDDFSLLQILRFLPLNELPRLSTVCTKWKKMISIIWSKFTQIRINEAHLEDRLVTLPKEQIFGMLKCCEPYIKAMHITVPEMKAMAGIFFQIGTHYWCQSSWTIKTLEKLFTKEFLAFERVEVLHLIMHAETEEDTENLVAKMIPNINSSCKRLRKLVILCNVRLSCDEVTSVFKNLPVLEDVLLKAKFTAIAHKDLPTMDHLTSLKLTCSFIPVADLNGLIEFFAKMPNILHLTLAGINDNHVFNLTRQLLDRFMSQKRDLVISCKRVQSKVSMCFFPDRRMFPETEGSKPISLNIERTNDKYYGNIVNHTKKHFPFYRLKLVRRETVGI